MALVRRGVRAGAVRGALWVSLAFASAISLSATLATSRLEAAPSAADVDTARALMTQGREERKKGNHAAALERFRAANKIMSVPTTALEVGQSQADLGLLVEARETWLAATRLPVEPKEPEAFAKARLLAQSLADEIAPRIPTVQFQLANAAAGATLKIALDDVPLEPEALLVPRKANPGKHVALFDDGKHSKKVEFELVEREAKSVDVDLATGEAIGAPVAAKPPPTPVEPTTTTAPVSDVAPRSPLRAPMIYGGFGLAGAGLIVGGVTGILAFTHGSAAKDLCVGTACPHAAHDDLAAAKSNATLSNVSFAVAGVGAVVGVVGLLLPAGAPSVVSPAAARSTPGASLVVGFGSIAVVGAF